MFNLNFLSSSCTEYFDAAVTDAFPRNRSTVRILDAGAGRGSTASYLRSLGYNNIDALTVSKERLDRAERSGLYRNFLFTALKAESTLYATGAFDAVICADGVFPDEVDPDAMDEMLRLVKPGSVFDVDVLVFCVVLNFHNHEYLLITNYARRSCDF